MEDYPSVLAVGYERSWEAFVLLVADLDSGQGRTRDHGEVERMLDERGREVLRCLYQDHLDARAGVELEAHAAAPRAVRGADGVQRRRVEKGRTRELTSIFGSVTVQRLVYRSPGRASLRPAEAVLNLPPVSYSAGLTEALCEAAARMSFDAAIAAVASRTGVRIPKRQAEALVEAAVADWEAFYQTANAPVAEHGAAVVITADGKGIVMRPEHRKSAAGRKKMAELACVYTASPVRRDPELVLGPGAMDGPVAEHKRLFASITDTVPAVIGSAFDEADRRDPGRTRQRVALVDGNRHQIDCVETEAADRSIAIHIVLDLIHVLEYVWEAARIFCATDEAAAAQWVSDRMSQVLHGRARDVATGIRRRATRNGYTGADRKCLDRVAGYLEAHAKASFE